ncbi:hypothetical protein FRC16_008130, partial [Serendipita sp. 398]
LQSNNRITFNISLPPEVHTWVNTRRTSISNSQGTTPIKRNIMPFRRMEVNPLMVNRVVGLHLHPVRPTSPPHLRAT